MIKLLTRGVYDTRDTEKYFDENQKTFEYKDTTYLRRFSVLCEPDGRFNTSYGIVEAKSLSTAVKLAICMMERPSEFFNTDGVKDYSLEKILTLPMGCLEVRLDEPLKYKFDINAKTELGAPIHNSAELNDLLEVH